MLLSSDTPVGVTKSMGLGLIGFADALQELQPDILVVLGDRFEILSASPLRWSPGFRSRICMAAKPPKGPR